MYADALRQAEARTDHPSRKRRRTRESPQRQPTRQLRQTAASPVNCQAADATRNKARSAAAPISTSQRRRDGGDDRRRGENPQADLRHDGEKNASRRHRQQDAAVKPIAGHGASRLAAARDKTTSRTILANAATRANTAPTSVETEKLKPSREVRRRILKRDDSLRTSHLKRTPHHQEPAPTAPKTPLTSPTPSAAAKPHAVRPAPRLTNDSSQNSPTNPSQTANLSTRRGGHPPPTQQDKSHQEEKPHLHSPPAPSTPARNKPRRAPRNAPSDTAAPA